MWEYSTWKKQEADQAVLGRGSGRSSSARALWNLSLHPHRSPACAAASPRGVFYCLALLKQKGSTGQCRAAAGQTASTGMSRARKGIHGEMSKAAQLTGDVSTQIRQNEVVEG